MKNFRSVEWKKVGRRILFPPIWLCIVLAVIAAAALIFVFVKGGENSPVAYVVYVVSFYALTVIVMACIVTVPRQYRTLKKKVYENKFANRYLTDPTFKTQISLFGSLGINMLYVVSNIVSGIRNQTAWFLIYATYYAILAVMRFLLLRYASRHKLGDDVIKECRRSRLCVIILMTLNLMLSCSVLMMVYYGRGFEYRGIMIYVMAMYTFYVTTLAIVNLVRYRKYHSPVMTTSKVISLAAAMVSMLSLETAMFAAFGSEMADESKELMIMATGAGIAIIVVGMSVFIIVRTTKMIKNLKR